MPAASQQTLLRSGSVGAQWLQLLQLLNLLAMDLTHAMAEKRKKRHFRGPAASWSGPNPCTTEKVLDPAIGLVQEVELF